MISDETIKEVQRVRLQNDIRLNLLLDYYRKNIRQLQYFKEKIDEELEGTYWKLGEDGYLESKDETIIPDSEKE